MYPSLIAPLIEAVKQLKAANDNLASETKALKAANDNQAVEIKELRNPWEWAEQRIDGRAVSGSCGRRASR